MPQLPQPIAQQLVTSPESSKKSAKLATPIAHKSGATLPNQSKPNTANYWPRRQLCRVLHGGF
ncbi:hypothetical protein [Microcoleus sp. S28C3]|uniref:hypothetical protein n=1 Tax=Microcoleus sp. S28C3 TaxID=3055414 RepID=UPI002FD5774E